MTRPTLIRSSMGLLLTAALLTACGTSTPTSAAPQPGAGSSAEQIVTVLNPDPALSDAQLAARHGGTLVTRTPAFAVIAAADTRPLTAQNAGLGVVRERNRGALSLPAMNRVNAGSNTIGGQGVNYWGGGVAYWGNGVAYWGGSTTLWGSGVAYWGGGVNYWGGGVNYWGGGGQNGTTVANIDTWQSIGLDVAQTRLGANGVPGAGVTIAVLDTGVDVSHPMFTSSLTPQDTWYDFADGDALPMDDGTFGQDASGHGTEVAGLALIVAPGAKIMPVRVLDAQGQGNVSSVVQGILWATDHGADIINLSLGSDEPVEAVKQAIQYANDAGVVVVASAGNAGTEGLRYPAGHFAGSALNLAVGSHGLAWNKSAFSQYGALSLLAPGEELIGPAPGGRLAAWSGTSMSAPVVAGAAALALSSGSLNGADAVRRIQATATGVDALAANQPYAGKLGAGRLNLDALTRP